MYDSKIYDLVRELKDYFKEASERKYIDTVVNYDLTRLLRNYTNYVSNAEKTYWRDKFIDRLEGVWYDD